ncbi:peptide-methionine (S)-S-oxide reductase [Aureococcus anophagefferens]|nr:peptide-methionine (S)-S-oxide reductase [Aureococcus anophagefferens]
MMFRALQFAVPLAVVAFKAPVARLQPRSPARSLGTLLDLMGGGDSALVAPGDALKGRAQKMPGIEGYRHFVLGTELDAFPEGHKVAVFANGCFWGSEKGIWRFPGDGITSTAVGYCAGFTPNPTYEEAGMGQGNDRGTQYRSGFYYFDDDQKALIEASMKAYEAQLGRPITTEVAAASDYDQYGGLWFYGEQYHQQYLAKPGSRPYGSAQPQGVDLAPFESWCPPGLESYAPKLPEAFWDAHKPRKGCSVVNAPNEPVVM